MGRKDKFNRKNTIAARSATARGVEQTAQPVIRLSAGTLSVGVTAGSTFDTRSLDVHPVCDICNRMARPVEANAREWRVISGWLLCDVCLTQEQRDEFSPASLPELIAIRSNVRAMVYGDTLWLEESPVRKAADVEKTFKRGLTCAADDSRLYLVQSETAATARDEAEQISAVDAQMRLMTSAPSATGYMMWQTPGVYRGAAWERLGPVLHITITGSPQTQPLILTLNAGASSIANFDADMPHVAQVLRYIAACWVLMADKERTVTAAESDGSSRDARRDSRSTRAVRTVSMHPVSTGRVGHGKGGGKLQFESPVQGFWRKQWYPSKRTHELKWIDGFVRGKGLPTRAVVRTV